MELWLSRMVRCQRLTQAQGSTPALAAALGVPAVDPSVRKLGEVGTGATVGGFLRSPAVACRPNRAWTSSYGPARPPRPLPNQLYPVREYLDLDGVPSVWMKLGGTGWGSTPRHARSRLFCLFSERCAGTAILRAYALPRATRLTGWGRRWRSRVRLKCMAHDRPYAEAAGHGSHMLECLGIPGFQEDDETEDQIGCPAQEHGCGRYRRHEYDLDRHLVSLRTQARAGSYSPDYGLVVSAVEDVAPRRDGMVWCGEALKKSCSCGVGWMGSAHRPPVGWTADVAAEGGEAGDDGGASTARRHFPKIEI